MIGVVVEGWVDYFGDGEFESLCDVLIIDYVKELKMLLDVVMNGDDVKGLWDVIVCVFVCLVLVKGGDW